MTEPLTPPDCDLRDFPFMPLDVVRLRDSDISSVSTGEEFRCAVLLWCASWHQVPAASLPDNDIVLSQLAGFGRVVSEWQKVREGALRGWIKCSDGRLYHPVVAEKALEAWERKLKHHKKKAADRAKIAAKRAAEKEAQAESVVSEKEEVEAINENVAATYSDCSRDNSKCSRDIRLTGTGTGTGTIPANTVASSSSSSGTEPVTAARLSLSMRKHGINSNRANPKLIALADRGVSVAMVDAAIMEAKKSKPDKRISPDYVVGIINRWCEEGVDFQGVKPSSGGIHAARQRASAELTGRSREAADEARTIEAETRVTG